VNENPTADAGGDLTGLEDHAVKFNASNSTDTTSDMPGLLYQWDYGDGAYSDWLDDPWVEHTYTDNGVYTVQLSVRDDDDAVDNATINVTIENVAPTCSIIVDTNTPLEDQEINFQAVGNDTASDMFSLTYYWDFGDGTGSGLAEPAHTYTEAGTYTVNLSVMDDDSDTGYTLAVINVSNIPPTCSAMTKTATVEEDSPAEFTGQGTDTVSDKSSLVFCWEFGDGNSTQWSSTAASTHVYERMGTYCATLSVKDDDGDTGSSVVNVTVENVVPTVVGEADVTDIDEDAPVVFDVTEKWDTASDLDGLTYTWDFGDGTAAQGAQAVHAYTSSGTYKAEVAVKDDDGATGTFSIEIVVNNVAPTAEATVDTATGNLSHEFKFDASLSSDTPSDRANLTYEWSFGDGSTTATGVKVDHTFGEAGDYWVSVTVSDSDATTMAWIGITVIDEDAPDDDVVEDKDTDGDGMADEWEKERFGDLSHNGSGDGDADGFTDLEEFEADTDPNDITDFPGAAGDDDDEDGDGSTMMFVMVGGIALLVIAVIVIVLIIALLIRKKEPDREQAGTDDVGASFDAPGPEEKALQEESAPPREEEMTLDGEDGIDPVTDGDDPTDEFEVPGTEDGPEGPVTEDDLGEDGMDEHDSEDRDMTQPDVPVRDQ